MNEKRSTSVYDDRMVRGLARAAQFNEQHGKVWDDECREALEFARKTGIAGLLAKPELDHGVCQLKEAVERVMSTDAMSADELIARAKATLLGELLVSAIRELRNNRDSAVAIALTQAHINLKKS